MRKRVFKTVHQPAPSSARVPTPKRTASTMGFSKTPRLASHTSRPKTSSPPPKISIHWILRGSSKASNIRRQGEGVSVRRDRGRRRVEVLVDRRLGRLARLGHRFGHHGGRLRQQQGPSAQGTLGSSAGKGILGRKGLTRMCSGLESPSPCVLREKRSVEVDGLSPWYIDLPNPGQSHGPARQDPRRGFHAKITRGRPRIARIPVCKGRMPSGGGKAQPCPRNVSGTRRAGEFCRCRNE